MRAIRALVIPILLVCAGVLATGMAFLCEYIHATYGLGYAIAVLVAFFLILAYVLGYITAGSD